MRSVERAVKNTEVARLESDGPCWSLSAVLLILASNTEVYLPSATHLKSTWLHMQPIVMLTQVIEATTACV